MMTRWMIWIVVVIGGGYDDAKVSLGTRKTTHGFKKEYEQNSCYSLQAI